MHVECRDTQEPPEVVILVSHKKDKELLKTERYVPETRTHIIKSINSSISTFVGAFSELIENSLEATWGSELAEITVTVEPAKDTITIEDNGCGMTSARLREYAELGYSNNTRIKQAEQQDKKELRQWSPIYVCVAMISKCIRLTSIMLGKHSHR